MKPIKVGDMFLSTQCGYCDKDLGNDDVAAAFLGLDFDAEPEVRCSECGRFSTVQIVTYATATGAEPDGVGRLRYVYTDRGTPWLCHLLGWPLKRSLCGNADKSTAIGWHVSDGLPARTDGAGCPGELRQPCSACRRIAKRMPL